MHTYFIHCEDNTVYGSLFFFGGGIGLLAVLVFGYFKVAFRRLFDTPNPAEHLSGDLKSTLSHTADYSA